MICIVLVGPQGSGKTTYCKNHLSNYTHINQDILGKQHWKIFTSEVFIKTPYIVVDRINHTKNQRKKYLSLAKSNGYKTKIIFLNLSFNVCLKRVLERKNHPIDNEKTANIAIKTYFKQFEEITEDEADQIIEIRN